MKSQNRTPYEDNHGNQDRRSESYYEVAEDNDLAGVCFHRDMCCDNDLPSSAAYKSSILRRKQSPVCCQLKIIPNFVSVIRFLDGRHI